MKALTIIALVWLLAFVFYLLSKARGGVSKGRAAYHYGRKEYIMDRAEHEFFDVLVEVVGDGYYVFPQVHLSTILYPKVERRMWHAARRYINVRSVDFVICDKAYIKPLLAIELDGRSHDDTRQQEKDAKRENIFKEAGLRLLRFANHGSPDKEDVKRRVLEVLASLPL